MALVSLRVNFFTTETGANNNLKINLNLNYTQIVYIKRKRYYRKRGRKGVILIL
jgi:hypothetical protein